MKERGKRRGGWRDGGTPATAAEGSAERTDPRPGLAGPLLDAGLSGRADEGDGREAVGRAEREADAHVEGLAPDEDEQAAQSSQAHPDEPAPTHDRPGGGISAGARADAAGQALAGMASSIADAAGPVISAALRPVDQLASGARRLIGERSGARVRRVRRMGQQPLLNLWEAHPEARRASIRELGLQTVLVDEIAGTAVEGAAQRGGDFLPLRDRRGADWRARWQRILAAVERLVDLPPVELLKFGERYWVVDGHNRVAAALYTGQVAVDAVVYELRMPGARSRHEPTTIAPYLEGSQDLRAAGSGRLTRTSSRPEAVRPRLAPAPDEHRGEPDGGRD